ncbi:THO complex subunit 2 [Durusdinium trenchii]|uniref:THO complex subunit 2 n=1 Tax=Durusdinium trenchii TaxID=1381693 RepID=A0ABP0N5W9_9DINO
MQQQQQQQQRAESLDRGGGGNGGGRRRTSMKTGMLKFAQGRTTQGEHGSAAKILAGGSSDVLQDPLERFREEYDKIKRSLVHSLEREKAHTEQIRELKARLQASNQQLQLRTSVVEMLEKQTKRLEEERQRAVRSETFAKEREANAVRIVGDLKERVGDLEKRLLRLPSGKERDDLMSFVLPHAQDELKVDDADEDARASPSAFESWKKVYGVWTPKHKREVTKAWKQTSQERRPRTAYELFKDTNHGVPHAHELVLDNRLTPMRQARAKLDRLRNRASKPRSRSSALPRLIMILRLTKSLPCSARIARTPSMGSLKLAKPYPLDSEVLRLRTTLAMLKDVYFRNTEESMSSLTDGASCPTQSRKSFSGQSLSVLSSQTLPAAVRRNFSGRLLACSKLPSSALSARPAAELRLPAPSSSSTG